MSIVRWVSTLVVVCVASSVAAAQPGGTDRDRTISPDDQELLDLGDPELVMMLMQEAYRTRPTNERVEIKFWQDQNAFHAHERPSPDRTSVVHIRVVPNARVQNERAEMMAVPVLGLELEQTQIQIVDDVCEAVTQHRDDVVFRTRLDGPPTPERIARALRPIPLPQIALAFGDTNRTDTVGVGLEPIVWSVLSQGERVGLVELHGDIRGTPVLLVVSSRTHKLVRASFAVNGDAFQGWIDLTVTPRSPQSIQSWVRDHTKRTEVGTFAQLAHAAESASEADDNRGDGPDPT